MSLKKQGGNKKCHFQQGSVPRSDVIYLNDKLIFTVEKRLAKWPEVMLKTRLGAYCRGDKGKMLVIWGLDHWF